MFPLVLAIGFLAAPAQTKQPAPATLQIEVRQALRRSALAGFIGTVSFQKEMWYPPTFDGNQYTLQSWKITTDGNGRLRAEMGWPNNNSSRRLVICETHTLMWLTGLNSEILVLDKLAPSETSKDIESKLSLIRNMANQAEAELEWLLNSTKGRRSAIEVLLLNRSPGHTGAVVKIDGKLRQVTFRRMDGTLLLASITRDEAGTTYRFAFKDYYRLGERWIPGTVEFEQHHAIRGTKRASYSQITLTPAQPGTQDFENGFLIPVPGDPTKTGIVVAEIFSKAFPGSVKMELTPYFYQLKAMREAQR